MRGDPSLEKFLGRWLAGRMLDADVAKTAAAIHTSLQMLLQGEASSRFETGLADRLSGLAALVERIDGVDEPAATPQSARGRWLRNARGAVSLWDDSKRVVAALDATAEKNTVFQAAVSQGLDDAVSSAPRPLVEPVRALRVNDEREFRAIPLPPGPQAPWGPDEYMYPDVGRAIVARLDSALTEAARAAPAEVPAKALSDLFRLIEAGWPVPRARLEGPLRQLAEVSPEGSDLALATREVLRLPCFDGPPPTAAVPEARADDPPRVRAARGLGELARALLSDPSPDAQAFGRRLQDVDASPDASSPRGLHQEFVGCLAFLDQPAGPDAAASWRAKALDRLARIAQGLGGGEVLDDNLLGRPLGQWTDFVTVVGYDEPGRHGEPRRITRVERVGYLLVFSDGARKALVRARVRVAL